MDNLQIDIDFLINHPEASAALNKIKTEVISGQLTAEQASQRIVKALGLQTSELEKVQQLVVAQKQVWEGSAAPVQAASSEAKQYFLDLAAVNAELKALAQSQRDLDLSFKQGAMLKDDYTAQLSGLLEKQRQLQTESAKLNGAIKQFDGTVASSRTGFNGLSMSIAQVTREFPAFIYSTQMGFMAISNNIPILIDQLNIAKRANAELTATGQKAVPVWRQFVGGLFSWNTALSIGVTLLAVYGKEIGEYVNKLFKGKDALDDTKKSIEHVNDALKGSEFKNAVKDVFTLRSNIKLATAGLLDKKRVLDLYNEGLGKTMGRVRSFAELQAKEVAATPAYLRMMVYRAAALGVMEDASKDLAEAERKRMDLEDKRAGKSRWNGVSIKPVSTGNKEVDDEVSRYREGYKRLEQIKDMDTEEAIREDERRAQRKMDNSDRLNKKAAELAKKYGMNFIEPGKDAKSGLDKLEREMQSALDGRRDIMERIARLDAEYSRKWFTKDDEELQALRDKFSDFRKIIEEENEKISAYNKKHGKKIALINVDSIKPIEEKATGQLLYRQETERLKDSLEQQKDLYAEYEDYVRVLGRKAADERFGDQLKGYRTFAETVKAEMAKIELIPEAQRTGVMQERLNALGDMFANAQHGSNLVDARKYAEAYQLSMDYNERVLKIEEDFAEMAKNIALIKDAELREAKLATLNTLKDDAIEKAKEEASARAKVFEEMNNKILFMSRRDLKEYIHTAEQLLASGVLGDDEKTKERITSKLKLAKKVIGSSDADTQRRQKLEEKGAIEKQLRGALSVDEKDDLTLRLANVNKELNDITAKRFDKIAGDMADLGGAFGSLAAEVGASNKGLGDTIATMGELLNVGSQAAGSIASFASGDIIGGITKGIGAITGLLSIGRKARESARQADAEMKKYYDGMYANELKYQAQLRERERQVVRLNKLTLEGLKDEAKLLGEQAGTTERRQKELLKRIQDEGQQITGKEKYKYGGVLGFGRKTGVRDVTASVAGKSYEELEELYTLNKLTEGTKELFEQLKALKDEGADVKRTLAELAIEANELYTGTTADAITNAIIEGYRNGKRSSADFAEDFGNMMLEQMLNTMQYEHLEEPVKKFYERYSKLAKEGGMTEGKYAELREEYNKIIENGAKELENLAAITGADLAKYNKNSLKGAFAAASQESIDLLAGQTAGMRLAQLETLELGKQWLAVSREQLLDMRAIGLTLVKIESNTYRMAVVAEDSLPYLKEILNALKNDSNRRAAAGF